MVCSWRLESLASTTPSLADGSVYAAFACSLLFIFFACWLPVLRDASWIYCTCSIVTNPNAGNKSIELQEFILRERCWFDVQEKVLGTVCKERDQYTDSWYRKLRYRKGATQHRVLRILAVVE